MRQLLSLVVLEQVLVLGVAIGIGIFMGTRLGSTMLPFLSNSGEGVRVVPPILVEVDWPAFGITFALLGAGMWAPPVRAWFLELFTPAVPEAAQVVPDAVEDDLARRTASTVSFVPSGPVFSIDIASYQAGGSLTIRMGDGDAAAARVTGRAPSDAMLVTGNGIRITNSAVSSAEYTVTVPRTVRRIMVHLGGSASGTYLASTVAAQDSLVIALTR